MSAHAARIKRLEDIANSVPRVAASELTDADIAKLLLNEAKRGKLETILPTPSTWSRPDVVNKQYLLSTIRSIESHNRREVQSLYRILLIYIMSSVILCFANSGN